MAIQRSAVDQNVAGAPAPAATKGGKEKVRASEKIADQGRALVASMSEAEIEALGSKSHTLIFLECLGMGSKRSSRRVAEDQNVDCATPVAARFRTTEDIMVPQIPITKDRFTGINPETDITWVPKKAGEEFILSYYEIMYLLIKDEYGGYCSDGENPKGVRFTPRLNAYVANQALLPTPTLTLEKGAIKASITNIDEEVEPGKWVCKPEYEEKFGDLFKKKAPRRASAEPKGKKISSTTYIAKALNHILYAGNKANA
jgi:hypothetical protein